MSESTIDGNNCFVCGKTNPLGLQLDFVMDGDVCRSEFTPSGDHCGFDGITHVGVEARHYTEFGLSRSK